MQKALMEMNLQVHHVVSDITGATGMRILRAIVAGERDPDVLASFRDIRCHSSIEVIRAALVGNDRDEHIFALARSLDLYDFHQAKIEECDRKLEAAVAALTVKTSGDIPALPKAWIKRSQANAPSFDVRAALYGVLGTDLTQIHGLGPSLALKLVAECGTDLQAWKSAKHFASWLCLAPGNKISPSRTCKHVLSGNGWQVAVITDPAILQPGRSPVAFGRSHDWAERHGTGCVLPPPVFAYRQAEGGDRDSTQDCSPVLQCHPIWYDRPESGRCSLRRTPPQPCSGKLAPA